MVDIQKDTFEMDYNQLAGAITEKTKVVPTNGVPSPWQL